jgi:hypothetical protein
MARWISTSYKTSQDCKYFIRNPKFDERGVWGEFTYTRDPNLKQFGSFIKYEGHWPVLQNTGYTEVTDPKLLKKLNRVASGKPAVTERTRKPRKPKLYYKIVRLDHNGNLVSLCSNQDFPEHFRVTYKKGEFVKAAVPGTRLFVFDSLHSAKSFKDSLCSNHYIIYSCQVHNPLKEKALASIAYVESYWNERLNGRKKRKGWINKIPNYKLWEHGAAPNGTYSATAVKLIEVVN